MLNSDGARAGQWTRMMEDRRELYVSGLVEARVKRGMRGISIGFRPSLWRTRVSGRRELIELELLEVSLVPAPMLMGARFSVQG
ncbi:MULTISPECIES: HK97 family phage prohead protease [Hyphomonas]|nr:MULTISPECIES: HK97 family phage prohead protease [Hyphomonas]